MLRRLALATLLAAAPAPAAAAAVPLERYAPVVAHDSREEHPLTSVKAFAGRVPGVERGPARPVVYGRRAGPWLQYWMLFAYNDQDRGLLRTGRHEGDWEVVQYRLRRGRLVQAVYAQHSGAETCGPANVRRSRGRPVVFLARGSHASYFRPGTRDRTWPDPNDEADGRGLRVRPRLVRVSEERPPWMAYEGRWGATRAGRAPGEMDSPRGPAFQGVRWSDPGAWADSARPCTRVDCDERGECDGRETAIAAVLAAVGLILAVWYGVRRTRRADGAAAAA
jgi:Vacuolar protein sorting-associated protein 62